MGLASAPGASGKAALRVATIAALAAAGAVASASPATAPSATPTPSPGVIYRCTAADGAVALQDEPCPRGQRQELREVAQFQTPTATTAPSAPASGATSTPAAAEPEAGSADAPGITAGEAPPPGRSVLPPPLWRCTDLNGRSRLADQYDPQPRCVPLSVLGVDLSRAPPSAATLCRTVEDACVELGGDAACAAWEERLKAAESALRSAFSDTQDQRRRERDRAKAVVENDCRD